MRINRSKNCIINSMSENTVWKKRAPKVCMLTTGHSCDDARIFFKEARSLVRFGAEVTIVCCDRKGEPEECGGVKFEFFPERKSWAQRMFFVRRLKKRLIAKGVKWDVVHCHEPDALLVALSLKGRLGWKVIYDSHEYWPGSFAQRFPSPFWKVGQVLFRLWESRLIRKCDGAIGASWAISSYLKKFCCHDNVETILNVPVASVFGDEPTWVWGETTVLCHEGRLGFDRGLVTMVKALELVSRKHDVVLRVVGDVYGTKGNEKEWLNSFLDSHNLRDRVEVTGWLSYPEVGKHIGTCHIGLSVLQKTPNNIPTSSNKVFNYMFYGLPFIGPDFRLAKVRLAQEGCGVLADSKSPESYARAICNMIENRAETMTMRSVVLKASKERYRWEHMEEKLRNVYVGVLNDAR